MQKIIIEPRRGFTLCKAALEELFDRRRELFDEHPFDVDEFRVMDMTDEQVADHYWNAVLRDKKLHFIHNLNEVRVDPVLLAKLEEIGGDALAGADGGTLVAIEIPDGVEWYVFVDDDGSEFICEKHRIWRG